jgi:uncharacterized protein
MATDHIRYDLLAQQALRGVVQRVLTEAAKNGLMGEHHFYISFDTRAPGVRISERLRERYPEEMTIVLQHQFWDLAVTEETFEVGLAFKGVPERLEVPFAALKAFYDPSVEFALQFDAGGQSGAAAPGEAATAPDAPADQDETKPRRSGRGKKVPATLTPVPGSAAPEMTSDKSQGDKPGEGDKPDGPTSGGEVVRLDRFRKK